MRDDDSLIGRTIRSNLFIEKKLGEGGMGRVYLAHNIEIPDRKYAVKVLKPELTRDPSFTQRFYEEACHQAELDHPNIVRMLDYFHIGDDYFLILEYVDGQALSDLVDSKGGRGLPEKQALSIIVGVLAGLDFAHQRAIVHRDVKSSNVLVDQEGRARLTDFGIAMRAAGLARTPEGRVIGTPEYMSPEQLRDSGAIDHRSDVYSAGVILFEMLAGKLPFQGESFQTVQAQQLTSPVPDPRAANPKIRRRVADMVKRALQKSPVDRYQGCRQFIGAIEAYQRRGIWKYYMVAASVLVAAGIYAGLSMIRDIPLINDAVRTTSHDFNLFCREQQNVVNNTRFKRIADAEGLSGTSDLFAKRIGASVATMDASVTEYRSVIRHMTKFNAWTLARVLKQTDPEPSTAAVRPVLQADYNRFAAHGELPTRDSMLAHCGPLGWVTQ